MKKTDVSFQLTPEALAHPQPIYQFLRNHSPYFFEAGGFWIVTRYDQVQSLLTNPSVSSNRKAMFINQLGGLPLNQLHHFLHLFSNMMLLMDPPQHTPIRRVANGGFQRKAVEGWKEIIQKTVDTLLDKVEATGELDVVTDLSGPLPAIVISELFGIPPDDREQFQRWGDAQAQFFGGSLVVNKEQAARDAEEGAYQLSEYLRARIREREGKNGTDLISLLINAYEAGTFNEDELIALCVLILTAGHVTTIDQLANGIFALLSHPIELVKLQENPSLINAAIEEILRFDTSVPFTFRITTKPISVGQYQIPAGQLLALGLSAANHDEAIFSEPGKFDISRADNRHISFAYGPHFCLGAILARLELSIAIQSLIQRFPNLKLHPTKGYAIRSESIMFKGFHKLPVLLK